ncbi:chymotrypsin B-like [Ruditapes philippinarum]|uniref:chymotrypsin B-like n=1 Tax=Ruditapes philippinarum TaxID=129788 RepID=UPI00295A677C|nr:chymotrypsin B-like [Ruditapes philippinarum]
MFRLGLLALFLIFVSFGNGLADEISERIKGPGMENTSPGEFKFLVKLKNKNTSKLIGAGILLKSKVVLSIGYNYMDMKPEDLVVVLGEHDRKDDSFSQTIDVDTIKVHPQLIKSLGTVADVALFKLSKRPKIGDSYLVETFGLENIISSKNKEKEIFGNSEKCIVPGYGLTEWNEETEKLPSKLKKFVPQVRQQNECEKFTTDYMKQTFLCSINDDLTAVCMYDGGTPLLCKKGGRLKLYGLTTAGTKYCSVGLSVFTRMSRYYGWIKRNANLLK